MTKVGIIDIGISNLYSIYNSVKKFESDTIITNDPEKLLNTSKIILPGVGSFPAAMNNLKKNKIDEIIINHIKKKKLFMGICLGMQLLFEKSLEISETDGLKIFKGTVEPFKKDSFVKTHIGWNKVEVDEQKKDLKVFNHINDKYYYFVHSYYVNKKQKFEHELKTKFLENNFCSGFKEENVCAYQFHPEKSSKQGQTLIEKFIESND